MSLSDAEGAAKRWSDEYTSHLNSNGDYVGGVLSTDEMFNSYWYIQNMCAKGNICTDVWSSNYTSYQVFEKAVNGKTTYSAQVWNPSDETIIINFVNEKGTLGSAKVPGHALVSVDPTKNEDKTTDTEYVPYESRDKVCDISGVVEAEDYDTNFGCEPTTDNTEGGYIGWIDDGDSLVYNVNVKEEADYVVDYRVQCTNRDKKSAIKLKTDNDNDYVLATYLDNTTTNWKNVKETKTIHLKKGQYQMKLLFEDGGFNFNYVKIYKVGTKPPTAASDDLTMADLTGYPEIDLSSAKVIDVSSEVNNTNTGDKIIDGDFGTRWESKSEDPQYFTIDLGRIEKIGGIKIYWEAAAAKNYTIQTSEDNQNWTTVFTRVNGNGGQKNGDENRSSGVESISFDKATEARYVKIYCSERLTGYGDSVYEIKLYGRGPDQIDVPEETTSEPTTSKPTTQEPTTPDQTTPKPSVPETTPEITTPEPIAPEEPVTKPQETTKALETTARVGGAENSNQGTPGDDTVVKNGSKFKVGKLVYKVKNTKKKTVSVVSTVSKKIKKVSVPKKVTYKKVSYKVVAIGNKAFKNRRRLIKVTIGQDITIIGKKAFYNCKNLKKIIVKSKKLKKIGKQAFRKIKKNAVVKVPAKKKKKYKKMLKSVTIK